jgi:ankyrin repeat protein
MDNNNKTPLDYACENSKTNPNLNMKNLLEYDNYCSTKGGRKKTQRKTQRKNKKQKKNA